MVGYNQVQVSVLAARHIDSIRNLNVAFICVVLDDSLRSREVHVTLIAEYFIEVVGETATLSSFLN